MPPPPPPYFPTPPSPPRYPNPPQKFVTWASLEAKLNYLSEASRENIKLNCISSSQWWARSSLLLIALLLFPLFQKSASRFAPELFSDPFYSLSRKPCYRWFYQLVGPPCKSIYLTLRPSGQITTLRPVVLLPIPLFVGFGAILCAIVLPFWILTFSAKKVRPNDSFLAEAKRSCDTLARVGRDYPHVLLTPPPPPLCAVQARMPCHSINNKKNPPPSKNSLIYATVQGTYYYLPRIWIIT